MKLTNAQVSNFVNIVSQNPSGTMEAKASFAIAMTKAALKPTFDAIEETRTMLAKRIEDAEGNKNDVLETVNAEFGELLAQEVAVENVPMLSINAFDALNIDVPTAEFILHLPFIKENVLGGE